VLGTISERPTILKPIRYILALMPLMGTRGVGLVGITAGSGARIAIVRRVYREAVRYCIKALDRVAGQVVN
jgi:hypothetical protein